MKAIDPVIQDAVSIAVAEQSIFRPRKGSFLIAAVIVLWVVQDIAPALTGAPQWAVAIVAGIGSGAVLLINALTKDGVTPSMAGTLSDAAWERPGGRHAIVEE